MKKLYFGDNLDVLREYIDGQSVDLIYLDPPFNSQAQYNVLFRSSADDAISAQAEAFRDTWTWGNEAEWCFAEIMRAGGDLARFIDALRVALKDSDMMAYLVMMAVRLGEMRRVLRQTGSLYLHCDPTASHYLKVILDGIFGPKNFRGEVIWRRTNSRSTTGKWPRLHDVLLHYSVSDDFRFEPTRVKADPKKLPHTLITGSDGKKYQTYELTAPGVTKAGESGLAWRGFDPGQFGRHWANSRTTMEGWDLAGQIHWPSNGGFPRRRDAEPFNPESRQVVVGDVWTDIDRINQSAAERLGYPTQKPLALLDRIIRASSPEGAVILDPFCGCGTTVEAAERAGRTWLGIDIAVHAIKVIESRLAERVDGHVSFDLEGMPRDFASAVKLAERDKYQFQWWANYLFNPHALREQKKGADRGIDGELFFPNGPGRPWGRMLTSVKGGEHVGPNDVRAFARVLERENAQLGLFICLNGPTREMAREAASVGLADVVHGDIPKLQIVAIDEWFKGKMPLLPPLEHLPSAAFAGKRRLAPKPASQPDLQQLALPFTLPGGKTRKGVVRHLNPAMVSRVG